MPEFDRFDEPNYSTEEVRFEQNGPLEQAKEAIEPIKKFLPYIIGAVVVLIIAWLAYDYFIGSMISATIKVKDTEGKFLESAKLKLYATGAQDPFFTGKDSSSFTVPLKAGSYRYEAEAPGYGIKKESFEISASDSTPEIVLSKDIEVEIIGLSGSFPQKLYVGGTRQFTVQLKNGSSQSQTVDLVAEGDIKNFEFTGLGGITIPAGSSNDVQIQVSVPSGTTVKDAKNGEKKEAVLRVKYTAEKGDSDFTLFPNPTAKITLTEANFSAKARENYNKDDVDLSIKNGNSFPIEGIVLTIEITSATKNNLAEVLRWFQFTEIANQSDPRTIEIISIPAGGTVKKELQVVLPLTAQKEPDIKGNIVLTAPFLSEPIKKTLTLNITESANYSVSLTLTPTSPIKIGWDSILGKYEDKMVSLNVKNTGQLQLQNVVVSVANDTVCSEDWLELIENSADTLAVGETKQLKMTASAPLAVRGQEQSKFCSIRYRFDNPLEPGYVEDTKVSFLEVVPQP